MATYDREAIEAFARVFEASVEQIEKIRDTVLEPEIEAQEFGQSWHREGEDFVSSFEKINVDLGCLADVLQHIHDTMLDNVNNFQSVDARESGHYQELQTSMPSTRGNWETRRRSSDNRIRLTE